MKTMRNLLTIMMVMVSTFVFANDNLTVKVERVNAKSIAVSISGMEAIKTQVQLKSENGSILYKASANNENFAQRLDLNALPTGSYSLEVENSQSFTTTPVVIATDSAFVNVADQVTIIKPVILMNGRSLDVVLPSEEAAAVLVTIFDKDMNKLATEPIKGESLKRFDLSKLGSGSYTVKMETKGKSFIQSVSLNK